MARRAHGRVTGGARKWLLIAGFIVTVSVQAQLMYEGGYLERFGVPAPTEPGVFALAGFELETNPWEEPWRECDECE